MPTRPCCGELLRRFVAKIECRWSIKARQAQLLPVAGSARYSKWTTQARCNFPRVGQRLPGRHCQRTRYLPRRHRGPGKRPGRRSSRLAHFNREERRGTNASDNTSFPVSRKQNRPDTTNRPRDKRNDAQGFFGKTADPGPYHRTALPELGRGFRPWRSSRPVSRPSCRSPRGAAIVKPTVAGNRTYWNGKRQFDATD